MKDESYLLYVACPLCCQDAGSMCVTLNTERGHQLVRCHAERFAAYRDAVAVAIKSYSPRPRSERPACDRCGSTEHQQCCHACGHVIRSRRRRVRLRFCSAPCQRAHELAHARAVDRAARRA